MLPWSRIQQLISSTEAAKGKAVQVWGSLFNVAEEFIRHRYDFGDHEHFLQTLPQG